MKDLVGLKVKTLQGNSRYISVTNDEAIVFEKVQGQVSVYVCALENQVVRSFFSFHNLSCTELSTFLEESAGVQKLTDGLRIGPLFKGTHPRRIVLRHNLKKKDSTPFIKVEPLSRKEAKEWQHNGSGWASVTNLSGKTSGLIIFIREVPEDARIIIDDSYSDNGIYFLNEKYEVYVENVKPKYAFGKIIPRA
jgi:hypothetical protein